MEDYSDWSGSATDLFHELNDVAQSLMIDTKDRRYPNDPRWLWRRLKEVKPNLAAIGIFIEKDDTDRAHGRVINITKEQRIVNRKQLNDDMRAFLAKGNKVDHRPPLKSGKEEIADMKAIRREKEEAIRIAREQAKKAGDPKRGNGEWAK